MMVWGAKVRALGPLVVLSVIACGDDDATRASDAGRSDASVDAHVASNLDAEVAPTLDAETSTEPSLDADAAHHAQSDAPSDNRADATEDRSPDASSGCRLSGDLSYSFNGGFVRYETNYAVSTLGVFRRDRVDYSHPDAGVESCVATLPACGSSAVDAADLEAAVAASDVQAAFTTDETLVLGRDSRPLDGSVLVIVRADDKRITVGDPCSSGDTGCTVVPAGVQDLTNLLYQLSMEQAASGPCTSMRL